MMHTIVNYRSKIASEKSLESLPNLEQHRVICGLERHEIPAFNLKISFNRNGMFEVRQM